MQALKAPFSRTILIYSPDDLHQLGRHINDLPIPLSFVKTSYEDIFCEFVPQKGHTCFASGKNALSFAYQKRLAFAPWYSNQSLHVQNVYLGLFEGINYITWVISAQSHEKALMRIKRGLCRVKSVTANSISAAAERFRMCYVREVVEAPEYFFVPDVSDNSCPKRKKLVWIGTDVYGASVEFCLTVPEAAALVDAYRALNNSLHFVSTVNNLKFQNGELETMLLPILSIYLQLPILFKNAQYSPAELCFLTQCGTVLQIAFIDSWVSFIWLLLTLVAVGASVCLTLWIRSKLFPSHDFVSQSDACIFLVSRLLGQSPRSVLREHSLALVAWSFGMFLLGNYIQTTITAIRSVPSFS